MHSCSSLHYYESKGYEIIMHYYESKDVTLLHFRALKVNILYNILFNADYLNSLNNFRSRLGVIE